MSSDCEPSPPRSPSPHARGPRVRTVTDLIFPTPTLTHFLNNSLERIPIACLIRVYRACVVCLCRMCDRIHSSKHSSTQQPSGPPPTMIYRQPNLLGQPKCEEPEPKDDPCRRPAQREVTVRVTTLGCEHIFGSEWLFEWIQKGKIICPTCKTVWFQGQGQLMT
jgi:hypothetical protein